MNRTIFTAGVFFGSLAVVLGAFGAHGLEQLIDGAQIQTFETGVRYQMYHAFLLLVLGNTQRIPERQKKLVYYLIVIGILFFSFSIYFLATNELTAFNFKSIGFITPLGGLLLIAGWLVMGYRAHQHFN